MKVFKYPNPNFSSITSLESQDFTAQLQNQTERISPVLDSKQSKQVREQAEQFLRKINTSNRLIINSNKEVSLKQKYIVLQMHAQMIAKIATLKGLLQQIHQGSKNQVESVKIKMLKQRMLEYEQQRDFLIIDIQTAQARIMKEKKDQQFLKEQEAVVQDCIHSVKRKIKRAEKRIDANLTEIKQLKVLDQQKQAQLNEIFEEKKQINNLLQEEKGNVRVYCRLRPCSEEQMAYEISDNLIKIKKDKKELKSNNYTSEFEFLFEKVFDEKETQEAIFEQLAELIQCSVDGKNVCIFAYGQTGSGKTFTMTGDLSKEDWDQRGFIPRSIEYIFQQVQESEEKGYKCKIEVSISEIYNDQERDLLKDQTKFKDPIKEKDFTTLEVKNLKEALLILNSALTLRSTANTGMNTSSSRSHLIFKIHNSFQNQQLNISRESSLVLVDLAGSERVKDTGVTGVRFDESKQINKSLTELGKVMRAIKHGQNPSFRSSKLTSVLQKYLEEDSKAVMFVNVSTQKSDLEQTINSLNFAESVKQCQIKKSKSV